MGRFLDAGTCRRPKAMQLSGRLDPTIDAHHHFYDADTGAITDIPLVAKSLQVGNGASAWHRAGRCPSRDPRPKPLTRSASRTRDPPSSQAQYVASIEASPA